MNDLKPWYAVATPHEDIRAGRLEESVFAANIWAVVQGTAPQVYLDPEEFFKKSYMTVGLSTVLDRVAKSLQGGEAGDRIISLQTAFGGGKTHTLVALWHLAKNAERIRKSSEFIAIRDSLGGEVPTGVKGVAVFTNASCDATQGRRTPEGVHTRTLWGELAVQLGGKDLYELVRANDEAQRVPQGLFVELLKKVSPCLILLDELADYCVGAAAVPVGDTTLADQTISFIQHLTEAVQQVPGVVVVATLPASKYEVAQSEKGQEAFVTLEKRFQRLGSDVKPVADEEIYGVVRSRLFETITPQGEEDYPKKAAQAYLNMYMSHQNEVPSEATRTTYRDQIESAFPFHPVLIDALYTRWGSHPDFQRTRGVLRLLASVVGDLWNRRGSNTQMQHLIQPCHIRWSIDAMQAALTRLWGPAYQSVAAADVVGERSNAWLFDEERGDDYRREAIGQGLASAILLGSFGGQGQRSGFSSKELKLACSRPGLNWSYTDGALLELETRSFYLHGTSAGSLGKRYWFGTKPTLNKLIVQYRQSVAGEGFEEEILGALKDQTPNDSGSEATWRILVDPGEELPEQKSLTLLLLPPSLAWGDTDDGQKETKEHVLRLSARCGRKDRLYRNTLLFLAATPRGMNKLRQAFRERAALQGVRRDYGGQLDEEQKTELKQKIEGAEKACLEAVGPAYTVALRVFGQEIEIASLADSRPVFSEHLRFLWNTLVEDEEWILRRVGYVTLRDTGLVPETGGINLKDAVDAFLRFTDKPAVASKSAVTSGLVQACKDGYVGIGRGAAYSNLQARYCRQEVMLDPSEDGVWIIPPYDPAVEKGKAETPGTGISPTGGVATTIEPGEPEMMDSSTGNSRSVPPYTSKRIKHIRVAGTVPVENWSELFTCFVNPAVRLQPKSLKIGAIFEIEMDDQNALDEKDPRIKSMQEAARQLGLKIETSG